MERSQNSIPSSIRDMEIERPQAYKLAEDIFSLQEPWRGRFLTYVARRAAGEPMAPCSLTEEEVIGWLHSWPVYRDVKRMLDVW